MKTYIKSICLVISLSLFLACKKKNDEPAPVVMPSSQSLTLRMTPKVGNKPLTFNSSFETENNERYTLSMFRYYISNISLLKNDGSEHKLDGKVLLVNANTPDYNLGDIPAGDYTGISFFVGIDSATNHLDPTIHPVSHPLAIQSPAIHWSWNSGYIFLMVEGSCDTTDTNKDELTYGQYSHGMFFHIGMDPLLRKVKLGNSPFTVSANTNKVLTIQSDINKLFSGIDLKTQNTTHTMGTMPLATKAANNIPAMFTIVHNQ